MSSREHDEQSPAHDHHDGRGATAVRTAPPVVDRLPQWKVLLHNDEVNDMGYVVETITTLTSLNRHAAFRRMLEAHSSRVALLLLTHREHAELLQEQFGSKKLTVTIEAE